MERMMNCDKFKETVETNTHTYTRMHMHLMIIITEERVMNSKGVFYNKKW